MFDNFLEAFDLIDMKGNLKLYGNKKDKTSKPINLCKGFMGLLTKQVMYEISKNFIEERHGNDITERTEVLYENII